MLPVIETDFAKSTVKPSTATSWPCLSTATRQDHPLRYFELAAADYFTAHRSQPKPVVTEPG